MRVAAGGGDPPVQRLADLADDQEVIRSGGAEELENLVRR
jgi:hypothetical protein